MSKRNSLKRSGVWTAQDSVPIVSADEGRNLLEGPGGHFSRSYRIRDINYLTLSLEEQEGILIKLRSFLNTMDSRRELQFTFVKRRMDAERFRRERLFPEAGDGFDFLRKDLNRVILSGILSRQKGLGTEIFMTLGVEGYSRKRAAEQLDRFDLEAAEHFKGMGSAVKPLTLWERINLLYGLYHPGEITEISCNCRFGSSPCSDVPSVLNPKLTLEWNSNTILRSKVQGMNLPHTEEKQDMILSHTEETWDMNMPNPEQMRDMNLTHAEEKWGIGSLRQEARGLKGLYARGLSVADLVCPDSFAVSWNHIRMGRSFVRVLKVAELPGALCDTFLSELTGLPFTMVVSVGIRAMTNEEMDGLINRQLAFVREEIHHIQQRNRRNQVEEGMLPPEILEREADVLKLRQEIRENDERLFGVTVLIAVFAEDMRTLNQEAEAVISECKRSSVTCEVLSELQEEGLYTVFPFGVNAMPVRRTLKSSSCTVFVPFSYLEVLEPGGLYYSVNAFSKSVILYNRETKLNFNGFILGSSGTGKSFAAKNEIINAFLKKDVDILILDPEQEYVYLTEGLAGQVVSIMPGGGCHINPLDITAPEYEFDGSSITAGTVVDPVMEKVSFMTGLFQHMLQKPSGLDSVQKSLIDECLRELYAPFMEGMRLARCPERMETPTMDDMLEWFAGRREPEAREIYYALKRYAGDGTLNLFSKHTNVELGNRVVCFDISSVGEELKLFAMSIIQDAMWGRLLRNRRVGRFTYIYVDECHLFFQRGNDFSAEFLVTLWKRARKYGGVPTGITQNTSDMVDHPMAKKLLSECNFIQILNQQSDEARWHLKNILNLSERELGFITSAPTGQGLFYTGTSVVPFYSQFPEDNAIYPYLTSDMKRVAQRKRRSV